jgi:hypothetical protein
VSLRIPLDLFCRPGSRSGCYHTQTLEMGTNQFMGWPSLSPIGTKSWAPSVVAMGPTAEELEDQLGGDLKSRACLIMVDPTALTAVTGPVPTLMKILETELELTREVEALVVMRDWAVLEERVVVIAMEMEV